MRSVLLANYRRMKIEGALAEFNVRRYGFTRVFTEISNRTRQMDSMRSLQTQSVIVFELELMRDASYCGGRRNVITRKTS